MTDINSAELRLKVRRFAQPKFPEIFLKEDCSPNAGSERAIDAITDYLVETVLQPLEEQLSWTIDQAAREWPRYQMVVEGASKWLSLSNARTAYNSSWARVEIGESALEKDGTQRAIDDSDRAKIEDSAAEFSGAK